MLTAHQRIIVPRAAGGRKKMIFDIKYSWINK
jgi:hypothetical protein